MSFDEQSGERFRNLTAAAFEGIGISENGRIVELNDQLANMLGYERHELVGQSVMLIVAPESVELVHRMMTTSQYGPYEHIAVRKDGSRMRIEVRTRSAVFEGRTMRVAAVRDITERRRIDDVLRTIIAGTAPTGQDFFRALVRETAAALDVRVALVTEILLTTDPAATPRSRSIAIWSDGELQPNVEYSVDALTPAALQAVQERGHVYLTDPTNPIPELASFVRFEARSRLVVPLCDAASRPIGLLIAIHDHPLSAPDFARSVLTIFAGRAASEIERMRADQAKSELEEQLRHTQKLEALGTLAGGVAHDFNNILSVIFAYTELAQLDVNKPQAVRGYLGELRDASFRARDLVQQILSFSRRQERDRRPVRFAAVIEEALRFLRAALPTTIRIETHITHQLPWVLASSAHLHQVIMNLGTNAGHAMRDSHGELRVTADVVTISDDAPLVPATLTKLPSGSYVRLSISDTGHGMHPATIERIFEPFFTTKGPGEGTGLGLAVVHGIVRDHDGAMRVESSPGHGTTFDVFLPAHHAAGLDGANDLGNAVVGHDEHVLFIDDEIALCDVARIGLGRLGYRVTAHNDPLLGLQDFANRPYDFDVLVTDLTMPGMSGTKLARSVLELRRDLPVLLVTGFGGGLTRELIEQLGIRALLQKPLNHADLSKAIQDALVQHRIQR